MLTLPTEAQKIQARAILELRRRKGSNKYDKYKADPIGFIENELRYVLTDKQKQIVESVWYNRKTNVPAAHGQGKTFIAACIVLAWLYIMRGKVITTAPTARQVKLLLWAEIRKAWPRGKFAGRGPDMTQLIVDADVSAYGFTADDTDENAFQGVHHERLLAVEDEASGITPAIDDGVSSCIAGEGNRILRIGNPTDPNSRFKLSCEAEGYIRIPAFDHPNVSWAYEGDDLKPEIKAQIMVGDTVLPRDQWPEHLPAVDAIPGAISVEWIEDARNKHGVGSNYWKSRVLAQWPDDALDSIIPFSWFEAAIQRYTENTEYWESLATPFYNRHGLDVADGGDDHATSTWTGPVARNAIAYPTKGDMFDVSRAAQIGIKLTEDGGHCVVDNTGVGAGALAEMAGKTRATGMRFGESAGEPDLYGNLKAEGFWKLREAFRRKEIAVMPFDGWKEVARELAAICYIDTGKKIMIEPKKETKKKLGKSPDRADAFMMAFFAPSRRREQQRDTLVTGGRVAGRAII